jgi:hypothetical protein
MKKLEISSLEALNGGVDCKKAGRVSTVLTGLAIGVGLTALIVGTGGLAGGLILASSISLDIAAGSTSIGVGIACW